MTDVRVLFYKYIRIVIFAIFVSRTLDVLSYTEIKLGIVTNPKYHFLDRTKVQISEAGSRILDKNIGFTHAMNMVISYPDVCFVDREGNEIFRFRRYDVGSSDEGD